MAGQGTATPLDLARTLGDQFRGDVFWSPDAKIELGRPVPAVGAYTVGRFYRDAGTSEVRVDLNGVGGANDPPFVIRDAAAEIARFDSQNNAFLIGTAAHPGGSGRITVRHDVAATNIVSIQNSSTNSNAAAGIRMIAADFLTIGGGSVNFSSTFGAGNADAFVHASSNYNGIVYAVDKATGYHKFFAGGSSNPRLMIQDDENVVTQTKIFRHIGTATSGSSLVFWIDAGAATRSLATGECTDVLVDLNRTVTFQAGSIPATQRAVDFRTPTYTATGAGNITTAATVSIDGAPTIVGPLTATNTYALWVMSDDSRFDGPVTINAKLTVTGAIDPTSVLLSGGTALFYESNDGSTAPVSGAATGRLRYLNSGTGNWQVSMQGSTYANLAIAFGGSTANAWLQGGNSFGAAGVLGTTDANNLQIVVAGTKRAEWSTTSAGGLVLSPGAVSGGSATQFLYDTSNATHTGLTAESIDVNWSLGRTVTFAGGSAPATQRAYVITAPTYAASSSDTIANAATLAVSGAPVAGANMTLSNSYSVWVQGGNVRLDSPTVKNVVGMKLSPLSDSAAALAVSDATLNDYVVFDSTNQRMLLANGTGALPSMSFISDPDTGVYRAAADLIGFSANGSVVTTVGKWTTTVSAQAQTTGTSANLFYVNAQPVAHTNLAAETRDVYFNLNRTVTWAGGGTQSTQRAVAILRPTYAAAIAHTLTNAATVAIENAPAAGANMTLTNAYALWIQAGTTAFGGAMLLDAGATNSYWEAVDGSSAAVAPANRGRIRYNDTTKCFQISVDTGTYKCIVTGAAGAELFQFGRSVSVPPAGSLQLQSPGSSLAGFASHRAGTLTGASLSVNAADGTRTYKLSIRVNGVEQASLTLNTGNTTVVSSSLNVSISASDVLTTFLTLTAGVGASTFTESAAALEVKY
jgi:hypothetical protein